VPVIVESISSEEIKAAFSGDRWDTSGESDEAIDFFEIGNSVDQNDRPRRLSQNDICHRFQSKLLTCIRFLGERLAYFPRDHQLRLCNQVTDIPQADRVVTTAGEFIVAFQTE
jgi:hypothetical protein